MNAAKILIVDDDQTLVRLLVLRLGKAGFEVFHAQDAYQGLRIAIEQKPDLVFLDIHMPAGEGFSVQERFQKAGLQDLPVIYISGDKSDRAVAQARKLGAFAVVHKPFEMDHILAVTSAALKSMEKKRAPQAAQV
jgi:DNA-binding response OmpR family regulator